MQEEQPLADAPQWRGPELIGASIALHHVIRQRRTHVMYQEIGIQTHPLTAQRNHMRTDFLGRCLRIRNPRASRRTACGTARIQPLRTPGVRVAGLPKLRRINKAHEHCEHQLRRHDFGRIVIHFGIRARHIKRLVRQITIFIFAE